MLSLGYLISMLSIQQLDRVVPLTTDPPSCNSTPYLPDKHPVSHRLTHFWLYRQHICKPLNTFEPLK